MVDVRENTLTGYDVPNRRRVAELPAGQGPTHAIADRQGRIVVADTCGDALVLFGLTPEPRELARLDLSGPPYGLRGAARDPTSLGRRWSPGPWISRYALRVTHSPTPVNRLRPEEIIVIAAGAWFFEVGDR